VLKRVFKAEKVNKIINDPTIRPFVVFGDQDYLDFSELAANKENYFLVNKYGAIIYNKIEDGIYEIHIHFLPEGRGKYAFDSISESIDYMFSNANCEIIIADIISYNRPSKFMARRLGANYVDTDKAVYLQDGKMWDVDNFYLTKEKWQQLKEV
jgi:RimJ/RimL family protein N-acetyltransferase